MAAAAMTERGERVGRLCLRRTGGLPDTRNPPLKETGLPPFASSVRLRWWVSQFTPDRDEGRAAMNASEPTNTAAGPSRELASRESDGVHVLLLWHPRDDALTVSVEDSRAGQCFEISVDSRRALDAFYHPYAYAA